MKKQTTLRDILKSLDGEQEIADNADTWDVASLYDFLWAEADPSYLDQEATLYNNRIYFIKPDGFMESVAAFILIDEDDNNE